MGAETPSSERGDKHALSVTISITSETLWTPGGADAKPHPPLLPPAAPALSCSRGHGGGHGGCGPCTGGVCGEGRLAALGARDGWEPGGRGERCRHSICKSLNERVCICCAAPTRGRLPALLGRGRL